MSEISLTAGQGKALEMIRGLREYGAAPKVAVLAGLAGTGKTTVLKYAAEVLGGYPIACAPTGKAAARLREVTGLAARTLHSWLYDALEDPVTGEVTYSRKPTDMVAVGEAPVLVVDEGSMVSQDLWEDVLSACERCRMNVVVSGDPFQLPPVQRREVGGRPSEFNLVSPTFASDARVDLTEITRQAADSPIIRATQLIRAGKIADAVFAFPRVQSSKLVEESAAVVSGGGAVLVHRNETRGALNRSIRSHLGLKEDEIRVGEPLLVMKNCYRIESFNGETLRFGGWHDGPTEPRPIWCWIRKKEAWSRFGVADLEDEVGGQVVVKRAIVALAELAGGLGEVSNPAVCKAGHIIFGEGKTEVPAGPETPEEREARLGNPVISANYGYALTCHKAQGSEWNSTLVVLEQSLRQQTEEGRRWLYTAATRARESLRFCIGYRS
jgi:exodeoxyribonuclease-5